MISKVSIQNVTFDENGTHAPSLSAGVPYEMRSREYVAHTINLGLNHSSASEPRAAMASPVSRAANVSRADVVAVAAMEGVGLAEAVLKYNLLASTARAVPFANVRAMSNWLHQPLQQVRATERREGVMACGVAGVCGMVGFPP